MNSGELLARRVFSGDPPFWGRYLRWQDGAILEVGPAQPTHGRPVLEFPQGVVTPGFVDGHTHFAMWALAREQVRLAGAVTRAEALSRIARAAPQQGWILGQGWDANPWSEPPEHTVLDQIQPGPVFLDSLDVHAAWVNTAALKAAGVTRDTHDPEGGRIVRDAGGHPTGLLLERAVDLVRRVVPPPEPDRLLQAVQRAQTEAHRRGVTGIHNVEGADAFTALSRLDQAGELRLRVLFHHPVEQLNCLVRDGIRSGIGGEWLTHGGVKMFLDGSLGSRTAWMLSPYEGTRDRGMPITSENDAALAMRTAAQAGIASVVHAIGDAAVRRALDLMERLPTVGLPHRVEHFQCVHPDDLARAARARIVASMQPAHLLTDIPLADRHWGARGRGAYAFRSLLKEGTSLVFGSDAPVASIDPREGVFAAMERSQLDAGRRGWYPDERLDFETVVRAYTLAAAAAGGVGHRRGTLAPGMDADFVVWEVDPSVEHGDGTAFLNAKVLLTVVGGEVVYSAA